MCIKEQLQHIIKNSLKTLNIDKKLTEISLEISKVPDCDYTSNISFSLTRELHQKPEEIANTLKNIIKDDIIENIEVTYPGTLNISLNRNYIINGISQIIEENINYGKTNIGNNRNININFLNINPTEELNSNYIRNVTYGDNLSRILKFIGFNVTKELYIKDTTQEINNLGHIIKENYQELCNNNNNYNQPLITKQLYNYYKDTKINEPEDYFKKEALSILQDQLKKQLDTYRINFDIFTSEQSMYDKGLVDQVLDKLNKKGYTYFYEDALWLKTSDFNDDKDHILINNDGTYTSLLPTIANYINKIKDNYNGLININNIDKPNHIKSIKASLEMLEKNKDILELKQVNNTTIVKDNKEISNINLTELINTLGINKTRYFFTSTSIDINMELNIDQALSKTKENPIYYIEKTNATIYQILKNYNQKITKVKSFSTIDNNLAYIIITKLYEFEDIVILSGLKQKPNIICDYLYELVTLFNDYYKQEEIITENETYTNERLNFLLAIKIVINNALDLIGIIAREEL